MEFFKWNKFINNLKIMFFIILLIIFLLKYYYIQLVCIDISEDGNKLVIGGSDWKGGGCLKIYQTSDLAELRSLDVKSKPIVNLI